MSPPGGNASKRRRSTAPAVMTVAVRTTSSATSSVTSRVEVDKPATGIAGLAVDFSPPAGATVPSVTLNVPLTAAGVAVLPIEQGLPLGSPGVWTVTVRFGSTPIGSKRVLLNDGTTASPDSTLAVLPVTTPTTLTP